MHTPPSISRLSPDTEDHVVLCVAEQRSTKGLCERDWLERHRGHHLHQRTMGTRGMEVDYKSSQTSKWEAVNDDPLGQIGTKKKTRDALGHNQLVLEEM